MEAAILGVFVVSAVAGLALIISAVVVRGRHPSGERKGVAAGRLTTGIILLALPLVLGLLGFLLMLLAPPVTV